MRVFGWRPSVSRPLIASPGCRRIRHHLLHRVNDRCSRAACQWITAEGRSVGLTSSSTHESCSDRSASGNTAGTARMASEGQPAPSRARNRRPYLVPAPARWVCVRERSLVAGASPSGMAEQLQCLSLIEAALASPLGRAASMPLAASVPLPASMLRLPRAGRAASMRLAASMLKLHPTSSGVRCGCQ